MNYTVKKPSVHVETGLGTGIMGQRGSKARGLSQLGRSISLLTAHKQGD